MNSPSPSNSEQRVAVLGAGVIGRVLATELHRAGIDTILVARGSTYERLNRVGVRTRTRDTEQVVRVPCSNDEIPQDRNILILALRANQIDSARALVASVPTAIVVPMMHLGLQGPDVTSWAGKERTVQAFPGFGGYRENPGTDAETIVWESLDKSQPTTVDTQAPASDKVCGLLEHAGFTVAGTSAMGDWMDAHAVFVGVMAAGIVKAGGSATVLAKDSRLLRQTCDAIRDGFQALHKRGVQIEPSAVDLLHRRLPAFAAPMYWRRALDGPMGEITMAPHAWNSRMDEQPIVWAQAIAVTGGGARGTLRNFLSPLLALREEHE